jgi:hypothetical protein
MIDRAKKGDVAAAKVTLLYALGKPAATVQPDLLMDHIAPCNEAHKLDPLLAGLRAMNAAPPGQESRAGRKALKRARRLLKKGIAPSANGSIGGNPRRALRRVRQAEGSAGPSWVG